MKVRMALGLAGLCVLGCAGCVARMNFDMSFDAALDVDVTKFANGGDVFGLGGDARTDDEPGDAADGDPDAGDTADDAMIDVDPQDVIDAVQEIDALLSGQSDSDQSNAPINGADARADNAAAL